MKMKLTTPIDYSKMTEEEFFAFLDSEEKRIRRDNVIKPLSPFLKKYARVATETLSVKSPK
jgi:hypothetical protein